jgi:dihydrofolate reductase
MGRKTWEVLPRLARRNRGSLNIVVTKQSALDCGDAKLANSLHAAIDLCDGYETTWVLGGAQLIMEALPLATEVVTTEIDANFTGDTCSPLIAEPWFQHTTQDYMSRNGLGYSIVQWRRILPHISRVHTPHQDPTLSDRHGNFS